MTTQETSPAGPAGDPRAEALDRLGRAVMALADESRHDRQARTRRDRLHLVLLVVVAVLVAGLATLATQNRQIHGGNAEILRSIRDCTTAGGSCYEQSNARTEEHLRALVAVEFDIAWCVKTSADRAAAQRCVADAQRARGN